MVRYKRIEGGEKNELSGKPFTKAELEQVLDLYIQIDGKGIHENNPKIHLLAQNLKRTVRSVENQLLGFRIVDTGKTGRANYNSLIKGIWDDYKKEIVEVSVQSLKEREDKTTNLLLNSDFKFRISAQLKNIIGKELITDDYIAVFELVKNSFDAHAKNVKVIFDLDKIIVWDDGKGMDKKDIITKWLFVAYSAKKDGSEDAEFELEKNQSYRDRILPKKNFAGSKGIGRFSADRLGEKLHLITKKITLDSPFWELKFSWNDFDRNGEEEFINIEIENDYSDTSPLPDFSHGTILEITNLRSVWPRQKILDLKWSLEKLINPFSSVDNSDNLKNFSIEIICEFEESRDKEIQATEDYNPRDIANGPVRNFVFETLNIKTTKITAVIEDEETLVTSLYDRGVLIYEIAEENPFKYIPEHSRIQFYYLNRSAKTNFTRLMGIEAVNFGSIFLFNNGFRVYPMGEPGDDTFQIDKRKGQGYARYLGLRELIGSIEVWGVSDLFQEASSRDGGLISSSGTKQLEKFLFDTLVKLERYVQPILWQIKSRSGTSDEEIDIDAKAQIIDLIAKLAGNKDVKLRKYSKDFIDILDEKTADTPPQIFENLKKIAEETGDSKFLNQIDDSKLEYIRIKKEKEEEERKRIEAEKILEEEKRKRKEAEEKAKKLEELRKEEEYKRLKAEEEVREERAKRVQADLLRRQKENQVKFYEAISSLELEDVLNLQHQIGIDANTIDSHISTIKRRVDKDKPVTNDEIKEFLDDISFATKKILAVTRFLTKENFMAASRTTKDDLISFLKNYLVNIYKHHLGKDLKFEIKDEINEPFIIEFKPIEMTIIVDNLISNSKRKNAKKVVFNFKLNFDKDLEIQYSDDGDGLDKFIDDPEEIFKRGFTTTRGSGLGLSHVRNILTEQGGDIKVNSTLKKGIEFILKIRKK